MTHLPTHVDSPESVGKHLVEARKARGLSQRELAIVAGTFSAAYISRLEQGQRTPSQSAIDGIAHALDVHPIWLAKGQDPVDVLLENLRSLLAEKREHADELELKLLNASSSLAAATPNPNVEGSNPSRPSRSEAHDAAAGRTAKP
jgi:transcriptional regulator with XRE-family HTH domain